MRAEFLREAFASSAILPFVYCYPPRTAYREDERPDDLLEVWARDAEGSLDLNLYIHIPFCRYRCSFCGLYTITTRVGELDLFKSYVGSVRSDLRALAPSLKGRRVKTVFVGGGTPLSIGVLPLVDLLGSLSDVFPDWRMTAEEVSIEASPDSVLASADELARLTDVGVNRVSIGVQSFDDQELKKAGRTVTGSGVIAASLDLLRAAGIGNIGVDLIIGLEGQTDESFGISLGRLLAFRPETVSLYVINPRLNTGFSRMAELSSADNAAFYRRIAYASAELVLAGYVRESSAQFKLPGRGGLLQKQLYFGGVSVLGLGSGARSYTRTIDYLNGGGPKRTRRELDGYLSHEDSAARVGKAYVITPDERRCRSIILQLHDLDTKLIPRGGDGVYSEPYGSVFDACLEMGLMQKEGARLRLTEKGFVHRDIICWALFSGEVLRRHSEAGTEFPGRQRFILLQRNQRVDS